MYRGIVRSDRDIFDIILCNYLYQYIPNKYLREKEERKDFYEDEFLSTKIYFIEEEQKAYNILFKYVQ